MVWRRQTLDQPLRFHVVDVPDMQFKASVLRKEGKLFATVDATYNISTRYGYGDSFQTENWGMLMMLNPSRYVTVTVAYDELDAYYPIPVNATNVSFRMNGIDLNWTLRRPDGFQLFDTDLPEITWRIQQVPQNFQITAHYEFPLQTTGETYNYLGEYALLFPLTAQFGRNEFLAGSAYNAYTWFGNSTAHFTVQTDESLGNITTYSIDGWHGTLKTLESTIIKEDRTTQADFALFRTHAPSSADSSDYFDTFPHGAVMILNDEQGTTGQNVQTIYIGVVATALILASAAAAVVYLKKRNSRLSTVMIKNP